MNKAAIQTSAAIMKQGYILPNTHPLVLGYPHPHTDILLASIPLIGQYATTCGINQTHAIGNQQLY